jgi:hypothetical protein
MCPFLKGMGFQWMLKKSVLLKGTDLSVP